MRFDISPWNSTVLSEFATKISDKNKDNSIQNVISNSATLGLIPQIDYFDKEIANNDNIDKYYIIRQGDFVYNPRKSNNAPYGPVNIYEHEQEGVVSPLYLCFKIDKIDKKYLYYYFKSNCWHRYMYLNGDSGARSDRVSIKDEVFFNIPVSRPSLETQQKISKFLCLIDERIETQIKIINNLESQKKYISKLLFDSLNCKTQLCMLCNIKKGQQLNGDELLDYGIYYMMNGGITPSGFTNTFNTIENTISISEGGNSCGYVQYNLDKFWSGGHCYTLEEINPIINNKFLYHFLKHKENEIMSLRIGTGLPNIQKKDLERFMVPTPTIEQQIKIIKVLDAIDNKLKLLSEQLVQFNLEKKYLLNNMFI